MKTAAFFAYADNYLIDVKFGIIMDVEASRAIRQAEVGASRTMIERTEATFGIKPHGLRPTRLTGRRPISTGLSTNERSRCTFQSSTNRSVIDLAHSHAKSSSSTRTATSISALRTRR